MERAEFERTLAAYTDLVERRLKRAFSCAAPQKTLYEAMRYSLLAGGKRIRPVLALAFCAACGADPQKALEAGCAVEMVHTYSLIHDDLPCMDDDDYRRGRPTNHKVYGEATAVLAGDGLLTAAFSVLAGAGLPPDTARACIQTLADAAGPDGMVGGQILDMEGERQALTLPELQDVHRLKTGALISAACQIGVLCAGGTQAQLDAAAAYASHVGLAFQIRDDLLDEIGDEKQLGKPVHSDEAQGKHTFFTLLGQAACQAQVETETAAALGALAAVGPDTEFLAAMAEALAGRTH